MNYLLLDTQNLLEPVGIMSKKEILAELGMTKEQFDRFQVKQMLFRDRYELVEEDFGADENKEAFQNEEDSQNVKISEGKNFIWYLTLEGVVYSVSKVNHNRKVANQHIDKKGNLVVSFNSKSRLVKNLVAETFMDYEQGDAVYLIDSSNPYNVKPSNLKIVKKVRFFRNKKVNQNG